jgi:hypothetical protein
MANPILKLRWYGTADELRGQAIQARCGSTSGSAKEVGKVEFAVSILLI